MIARTAKLMLTTLAAAGLLAACDASVTQPGLVDNASVAFAKGGNSEAAKACQNGGYQSVTGTDGATFKNAGECVSHVAGGGALLPVGGAPRINEIEIVGLDCTGDVWTASFVMVFSGGIGTVNGHPMTSGEVLTIRQSADGLYLFMVTNGFQSAFEERRFNCT